MVVELELREWEEVEPVVLPFINEESEELFQFLVDTFRLSVGLRVISGGGTHPYSEEAVEFTGELRHKLRTAIGDNIAREAMELPDIV